MMPQVNPLPHGAYPSKVGRHRLKERPGYTMFQIDSTVELRMDLRTIVVVAVRPV